MNVDPETNDKEHSRCITRKYKSTQKKKNKKKNHTHTQSLATVKKASKCPVFRYRLIGLATLEP